ncbi:diguanylate cyclase (GGDEF) domain-containing protein [Klenkia soli]|uniref:Diguanylate cyclase (GGDEF) domain-containing protein n=1 Tax=Klenkia soli TaxID=1052260 RepID=A0A1H0D6H6_9ACTN|nr:bifunctional diguanylate cyclase/phosphodiesterase [Klenkia soli]SDN65787.1 diguanylate cyclase (GGDEF) domain-containing protein [Klenkia soli]
MRRPWTPAVFAGAVAVAVAVPAFAPVPAFPGVVLVGLLTLAFLVTDASTIDVEFRRQTYVFFPVEFALVVGLVEVGGLWTALARVLALGVVLLRQPYGWSKAAFNLALGVVEIAAAWAVVRALGLGALEDPRSWLVLLVAVVVVGVVDLLMVGTAVAMVEGRPPAAFWVGALVPSVTVGPLCVALALVALQVTDDQPLAWVLVVPVVAAILLVFRQSATAVRERRSVQSVHDFARRVEQLSPDEDGTRELVRAVRELLNADRVALWLPPYLDEEPRLVLDRAGEGPDWYAGPSDPEDLVRRRAVDRDSGGPVLLRAAKATAEEREALRRRAAQEVLGAPIVTAAGEYGYLEVCDRQSDVVPFESGDRAVLDSMLTHVNAVIRQQQLLTRIRYDADHDGLTGLPNRQRLATEIDVLLQSGSAEVRAGLVFASLDNYTDVTDTLGHAASDELLLVTAGLLREHAPPAALVARMEGGQFAVLLPGLSLPATERAARRLRDAAATRARVAGLDLDVLLTFGVAAAPVHGTDSGTLMQRADVALLAGHSSGGVASYHPVLDQQSLRRLQLGTELESAMAEKQITVVFQPIVDTRTSDIVSVETLVRWAHPRYGNVPPDDFIGLAEQIGRIGAVTDYVLDLALERCRKWLDQDIALSVAVNLSARCLAEPDLVDRVRGALRHHGVPGSLLTLELTEGIVVDDSVRNSTVLADLHSLGLRLSMDDFGTGYSSLSQLRQLPIDELKIDKSFVLGMSTSQSESFIARSIVELAHNLGLRVVAEGVEDEVTRDLLAEMGCDKLQGFLVSRPLPDDRLENWLLARTGVRSAAPGAPHRRLFVRS